MPKGIFFKKIDVLFIAVLVNITSVAILFERTFNIIDKIKLLKILSLRKKIGFV